MTNGSELKSRSATALRAAGYIPLPRWWVTKEQLELIAYMIRDNVGEVNHIRRTAAQGLTEPEIKAEELEAAWEMQREWQERKTGKANT